MPFAIPTIQKRKVLARPMGNLREAKGEVESERDQG